MQFTPRTISWTLLVCVAIAVVFIGVRSFNAWTPLDADGPIEVRVTGHEFFWKFRFPGADGQFDTPDHTFVGSFRHR